MRRLIVAGGRLSAGRPVPELHTKCGAAFRGQRPVVGLIAAQNVTLSKSARRGRVGDQPRHVSVITPPHPPDSPVIHSRDSGRGQPRPHWPRCCRAPTVRLGRASVRGVDGGQPGGGRHSRTSTSRPVWTGALWTSPCGPASGSGCGRASTSSGREPHPGRLGSGARCFGAARAPCSATRRRPNSSGCLAQPSADIHVTVPASRMPRPASGIVLHRVARAAQRTHPTLSPPRTTAEHTVIDLAEAAASVDDAVSWLIRGVGAGVTTAGRLIAVVAGRAKVRRGPVLRATLRDIEAGCRSLLELRYLREVERAHRLPTGARQAHRATPSGSVYDDVVLRGAADHRRARWTIGPSGPLPRPAPGQRGRGRQAVRFCGTGADDVTRRPCEVAAQVAAVLRQRGWRGQLRPCGRRGCLGNETAA